MFALESAVLSKIAGSITDLTNMLDQINISSTYFVPSHILARYRANSSLFRIASLGLDSRGWVKQVNACSSSRTACPCCITEGD